MLCKTPCCARPRQKWTIPNSRLPAAPRTALCGRHRKPGCFNQPDNTSCRNPTVRADSKSEPEPASTVSTSPPEGPESEGSGSSDTAGEEQELDWVEGWEEKDRPRNRPAGYTPFEYITFGKTQLTHELAIQVDMPLEEVFWVWREQANYGEWFDIIGETILHRNDARLVSYFCYYQWGHLPAVQLYTTLRRMEVVENESMHEQSVEGMPLATAVYFEEAEGQSTKVSLRMAYLMPENLRQYVGPMGVWGDVNDILMEGLLTMKEQIEDQTAIYQLDEEGKQPEGVGEEVVQEGDPEGGMETSSGDNVGNGL